MNYNDLTLDELKAIAKEKGLTFGKIGREKLIERLEELDSDETETKSSILDLINESVDSVASDVSKSTAVRKQKEVIDSLEEIPVRSITLGGTTWVSPKTNAHYRWNEMGAIEYIPFGELCTLNNSKRNFLYKPMVIVMDERVIEYFRLNDTYEKVAQIHNLKKVFATRDEVEISKVLDTILRVNMRDVAISKIRDMRKNGELVDIDIINLVEKRLCFDLSDDNISK